MSEFREEQIVGSLRVCGERKDARCDGCVAYGRGLGVCIALYMEAAELIEAQAKRIAELALHHPAVGEHPVSGNGLTAEEIASALRACGSCEDDRCIRCVARGLDPGICYTIYTEAAEMIEEQHKRIEELEVGDG